jgi:hypothetical protein
MCIKIGGWVRAEAAYGVNGSSTRVTQGASIATSIPDRVAAI